MTTPQTNPKPVTQARSERDSQAQNKVCFFPSGLWYASSKRALVESLFRPVNGRTASGWYKTTPHGVRFYDAQGAPFLFLFKKPGSAAGFVTCTRTVDGKLWYNFSTTTKHEKMLGLDKLRFSEQSDLAEEMASQIISN